MVFSLIFEGEIADGRLGVESEEHVTMESGWGRDVLSKAKRKLRAVWMISAESFLFPSISPRIFLQLGIAFNYLGK